MRPRVVTTRIVAAFAVCSVAACAGRLAANHHDGAEGGAQDAGADVVAVPLPVDCSKSTLVVSPATTLTSIQSPASPAGLGPLSVHVPALRSRRSEVRILCGAPNPFACLRDPLNFCGINLGIKVCNRCALGRDQGGSLRRRARVAEVVPD
jgi:hypothetical protein